jgi:hypothetical protein
MLKGCQKRVLWIRNIESDCFEEAYFIVSDKPTVKKVTENSMVSEANRIISEYPITNYFGTEAVSKREKKTKNTFMRIKWFLFGGIISLGVTLLVLL